MIKRYITKAFTAFAASILLTIPVYGSEALGKPLFSCPTSQTKWEPSDYDEAYQGANYNYSLNPETLKTSLKLAKEATQELSQKEEWNEEACVILDWMYALIKTEEELLTKPFAKWTIADVRQIAAWLTRLTLRNPGAWRSDPIGWQAREITKEEWEMAQVFAARKKLSTLSLEEQKESIRKGALPDLFIKLSEEEEAFLEKTALFFPEPEEVEGQLKIILAKAQKKLKGLKEKQDIFSLGIEFHYDIVAIHPFDEGSKRLGRLCMYIIHKQHGIKPLGIVDGEEYKQVLIKSLQQKSYKPFEAFYTKAFTMIENQMSIFGMGTAKKTAEDKQHTVKKCSRCYKEASDLKVCGRCKKAYYCNRECQVQDWKNGHKKNCK